jgi:ElaB/YqjD/DUF883 family membrane-anchored ribosome-binding protein
MSSPFSTADSIDPQTGYTAPSPSVAQAASDLRAAAGEKAAALKERALESASHLREVAAEKAAAFKNAAAEKASHFKDTASEQWHGTRVKAKEIHVTTEDYIRENPTKCVLGALGVGFLIGLIVRR